jgi:hypothetical protein
MYILNYGILLCVFLFCPVNTYKHAFFKELFCFLLLLFFLWSFLLLLLFRSFTRESGACHKAWRSAVGHILWLLLLLLLWLPSHGDPAGFLVLMAFPCSWSTFLLLLLHHTR